MMHFNYFMMAWVLWLFPVRHFVSRNFDGSLSYCRGAFNGILNPLVWFYFHIHPELLEVVRFILLGWIHLAGIIFSHPLYIWKA